jgi:hypothetical protein
VKKKTEMRKLVLAKETLARLESSDLRHVAGATVANTNCDVTTCISGATTCACTNSNQTCGTRYC